MGKSEMKGVVLAYRKEFQEMYFSKDNFLIPYYISKELGLELHYYYTYNNGVTDIPKDHRGTSLYGLHRCQNNQDCSEFHDLLFCVWKEGKKAAVLFLNGSSLKHMIAARFYKLLNSEGKVVVFGDMEAPQAREFNKTDFLCPKGIKGIVKKSFTNFFMNNSTYLVANTEAYNEMKKLCDRHYWKGLLHFYPCLDDEKFNEYGMKRKSWEEKENIMVCVGRIGNYQKNTEMLLDALKFVDLKDWKIYMIGPITSSFDLKEGGNFQNVIDQFFKECPQHKDKLIFTGTIYDQKEILEYYNRAKVLLSTSRHEGFANIYSQATALGCYVISTDVGGADVGSNNWQFGTKINQEDSDYLSTVLSDLVDKRLVIDDSKAMTIEGICYSFKIKNVLLPKMVIVS